MHIEFNEFLISDDKSLLDYETICGFLSRSYWASKRPKEKIIRSFQSSECVGVYQDNRQVGFARLVTDYETVYYLCDVYIDEDYRGRGIGKKLIESITTSDKYKNLSGILRTKDAHGLYEEYQFVKDNDKYMGRMPDFLREKP
ncbi:GNAT family N-acetyltransferase [Paenibacillus amylolyticus]|uniref:GNAT family N-acetyltransferase n=1 Tax=Paenibacillus amylolyticus TaxID=1451 RepID=A0A5M9WZT8_PAEAM|nr:GNAT family N-acetyltransferase [Paenibacillus amylolyticus]KAA8787105.1 GNAT family N-acetyltransferase [Paenibacillus amylolyticus]